MKSILDVRIQKLFLITLVLKVGSSFLGWRLHDPWILGFAVPLFFMATYVVLGHYRHDRDVTDEKFADSCYYLGFIFTITSLIFSLFDLPYIGTRITEIAVRFGAAMVSTVIGLAVRVYLVSFKKDVADAIADAEDALLNTTRNFTEQLTVVVERLRDFESQVDSAARISVERVNLQVENLSKNHAEKLTAFFGDLTTGNQQAFSEALSEVKTASHRLSDSVDGYSLAMRSNLASIEAKVTAFAQAVTDRLQATTFPDDYFARHMEAPLLQLHESAGALASGVKAVSQEVVESSVAVSDSLKKLRTKAKATEGTLDVVLSLTQQQQAVLDSAQGQLSALAQLSATLNTFDATLGNTLAGIKASNDVTTALSRRVSDVVGEGAESRQVLAKSLAEVVDKLEAQAASGNRVAASLDAGTESTRAIATALERGLEANATASHSVAVKLEATASVSQLVVRKFEQVALADAQSVASLNALGLQASAAISRVDQVCNELHQVVRQLTALDATFQNQKRLATDVLTGVDPARLLGNGRVDDLHVPLSRSEQVTAAEVHADVGRGPQHMIEPGDGRIPHGSPVVGEIDPRAGPRAPVVSPLSSS